MRILSNAMAGAYVLHVSLPDIRVYLIHYNRDKYTMLRSKYTMIRDTPGTYGRRDTPLAGLRKEIF